MRFHVMENSTWNEGQLGAVEGVLETINHLIIDRCIMEEVKTYHRNLSMAFYDYKETYDKVNHDWTLRIYKWMSIPENMIALLGESMKSGRQA